MNKISEVIVVEGKYDKNALSQVVDASIVTLEGFAAFHDKRKLSFLRRLAEKRGLIILTDSDGAGFVLRNYLKGALPPGQVKHAYIPDIQGKERRKRKSGKEGKLGVEGMRPEILLEALRRAGATFTEPTPDGASLTETPDAAQNSDGVSLSESPDAGRVSRETDAPITMTDFFEWGLSGAENSAERRRALLRRLALPEKLSARAMLDALNSLYGRERLCEILRDLT